MLATLVIIVACLFFLGLGLLISTNVLVVLIFAAIGLMFGSLVGVLMLRGGPMSSQEHWAVFVGPLISGLFFAMLCGILNLLVQDAVGFQLGGIRMFSVSFLLGTAPGLIIGWLLGVNLGGQRTIRNQLGISRSDTQPPLGEQRRTGDYSRQASQLIDHSVQVGGYGGQPTWTTQQGGQLNQQNSYTAPYRPDPLGPSVPLCGSGGLTGGWQPMPGAAPPSHLASDGYSSSSSPLGNVMLMDQVSQEQTALSRYGQVQILAPHDRTLCVVVYLYDGQNIIYMVCPPTYPQQPPDVTVESRGLQQNVGSGVLFPWNGSLHRLEHIVADLIQRL